jgi:hypothetical protein
LNVFSHLGNFDRHVFDSICACWTDKHLPSQVRASAVQKLENFVSLDLEGEALESILSCLHDRDDDENVRAAATYPLAKFANVHESALAKIIGIVNELAERSKIREGAVEDICVQLQDLDVEADLKDRPDLVRLVDNLIARREDTNESSSFTEHVLYWLYTVHERLSDVEQLQRHLSGIQPIRLDSRGLHEHKLIRKPPPARVETCHVRGPTCKSCEAFYVADGDHEFTVCIPCYYSAGVEQS